MYPAGVALSSFSPGCATETNLKRADSTIDPTIEFPNQEGPMNVRYPERARYHGYLTTP